MPTKTPPIIRSRSSYNKASLRKLDAGIRSGKKDIRTVRKHEPNNSILQNIWDSYHSEVLKPAALNSRSERLRAQGNPRPFRTALKEAKKVRKAYRAKQEK